MITKSTRNAIANVSTNPFQGTALKVLCVCSAGLMRSPTLANVLHKRLGHNTRAVGTAKDFALTPINEAHIAWCDVIVFVDEDCKTYLDKEDWELIQEWGVMQITLDIPDEFIYGDPQLEVICFEQYCEAEDG